MVVGARADVVLWLAVVAGCGRIGFDPFATDGPTDAPTDGPPVGAYWITTSEGRGLPAFFVTRPLDGAGFGAACPSLSAPTGYRFLLPHPTLPYLYGVEQRLDGIALGCTTNDVTQVEVNAASRPISRVVLDPVTGAGFFNADGPGSTEGVYRFTIDGAGIPSSGGSVQGPNGSGPMALDGNGLYVTGTLSLGGFVLGGAELALPASGAITDNACTTPSGVFVHHGSSDRVIVTCTDSDLWFVHVANPQAPVGAGTLPFQPVSHLVPLSSTRAVIARSSPPRLAVVDFDDDSIVDGPQLPSIAHALAVSLDRAIVVTSYPLQLGFQLAVFRLNGTVLTPFATIDVTDATELPAVAISVRGP